MTTYKITESAIEEFAIELLEKHSYQYIYGPDIATEIETSPPSGGRGATEEADNKLSNIKYAKISYIPAAYQATAEDFSVVVRKEK